MESDTCDYGLGLQGICIETAFKIEGFARRSTLKKPKLTTAHAAG